MADDLKQLAREAKTIRAQKWLAGLATRAENMRVTLHKLAEKAEK
jgi:hypothetical protein